MAKSVSIILTVNNRPEHVTERVAKSLALPGNGSDELVVVLDRPPEESAEAAARHYATLDDRKVKFVTVLGEKGWKGPARAWNHGFNAASGDLFYCISSEVIQEKNNVEKAAKLAQDGETVVFGACHNSQPDNLVVGAEPGVLVNSTMPRPLGFIVCMPAAKVREIGGFDEEFMKGYWYDDDDFFLRLWKVTRRFLFTDDIHGIHLHHERPVLQTKEGEEGISRNMQYMMKKHGTNFPWRSLPKIIIAKPGVTIWEREKPKPSTRPPICA